MCLFVFLIAGCRDGGKDVEEKAKKANKKAKRVAREVGEGAKLAAKDAVKGGKKVARKLHKRASRWVDDGQEVTARAVNRAKEKARDVADIRLCRRAYDYFVKCWPTEAKNISKSKLVAKCSGAVASGNEMIKKLLSCLEKSQGDCKKVKDCVPPSLLKVLSSD